MGPTEYKAKKREIGNLEVRLAAVQGDLDSTGLNTEQYDALSSRSTQLAQKIDKLNDEIKKYESNVNCPNLTKLGSNQTNPNQFLQITNRWEEHLHYIDHDKSKRITESVFKKIKKNKSKASLFLFQNYDDFLGKRYVRYLKETICSAKIGRFSTPHQIGFPGGQPNVTEFLQNLGEALAIETLPHQNISIDSILKGIKLSVRLTGGNVFFLEVNLPHLNSENEFVKWFLNVFWKQLLDRMPDFSAQNSASTFIVVVTIETALEESFLKECSCGSSDFSSDKFIRLPEDAWGKEATYEWLNMYSQIPLEQRRQVFDRVWRVKPESPFSMEIRLLRELDRCVS